MDPQSAVNALNQPWWANNPPSPGVGSNAQSFANALGGSSFSKPPLGGWYTPSYGPRDYQIQPGGFAARLHATDVDDSRNVEQAPNNPMHGVRQKHLFHMSPAEEQALAAYEARGAEPSPNSNLAMEAGYNDITGPPQDDLTRTIADMFRGGNSPPEMQPKLPDLAPEQPSVPLPRPRPKKK